MERLWNSAHRVSSTSRMSIHELSKWPEACDRSDANLLECGDIMRPSLAQTRGECQGMVRPGKSLDGIGEVRLLGGATSFERVARSPSLFLVLPSWAVAIRVGPHQAFDEGLQQDCSSPLRSTYCGRVRPILAQILGSCRPIVACFAPIPEMRRSGKADSRMSWRTEGSAGRAERLKRAGVA